MLNIHIYAKPFNYLSMVSVFKLVNHRNPILITYSTL